MSKFTFKPVTPKTAVAAPVDVVTTPVATAPAEVPTASAAPVVPSNSSAVAAPAEGAVTEYRAPAVYGDDAAETEAGDIILPRLNFVQKVGDLSNLFTDGDVLLNKETVILKAPVKPAKVSATPLNIVVVGFRKDRFAEKTVGGVQGDIVGSEAEVFAKGGTTDYNEAQATKKKYYQTLAECLILIEKPADVDDPSFAYVADGKRYAVALWTQKGTSYTAGTKVLRTARKIGWLKDDVNSAGVVTVKRGYHSGVWELRAELKEFNGNFAWVPQLKRLGYSSPEVQALATSIL